MIQQLMMRKNQSSKGPIKGVNFVILKSPHERRRDDSIVHRQYPPCLRLTFIQGVVTEEVNNSTTTPEIIWRFSRYPENSGMRITPRQNPHFYPRDGLPNDALSYGSKFHTDSLKDFGLGLGKEASIIYVLVDKPCRLFLDAAKPHKPRIFGNLWKPHQTVILKGECSPRHVLHSNLTCILDVNGILESEHIVYTAMVGKRHDFWHRPSITDSSQRRPQPDYLDHDSKIVNKPVGNWRALVDLALRCQNVDLMVRDQSRPYPPADSGWVCR